MLLEWIEDLVAIIPNSILFIVLLVGFVYVYVNYFHASQALTKSRLALESCEEVVYSHPDGIPESYLRSCSSGNPNVELDILDMETGKKCTDNRVAEPSLVVSLPVVIYYSDTQTHVGLVICKVR